MASEKVSRRSVITGLGITVAGGIAGFFVAKNSKVAKKPSASAGSSAGSGYGAAATSSYGSASGYANANASGSDYASVPGSTSSTARATTAKPLATVSQVPVKGGLILGDKKIVLTRDSAGTVHGFSAICTHLGCTVGSVKDGLIFCPCHGSEFNSSTGAVVQGPATKPLPPVRVIVRGTGIYKT